MRTSEMSSRFVPATPKSDAAVPLWMSTGTMHLQKARMDECFLDDARLSAECSSALGGLRRGDARSSSLRELSLGGRLAPATSRCQWGAPGWCASQRPTAYGAAALETLSYGGG